MDRREVTQLHGFLSRRQKISLPMDSKAEDTLKVLWLNQDTSGHARLSNSPSASCSESSLDGSGLENSVASGPSSPSAAHRSLRCRNCERLFSKMRGQRPLRKKHQNVNPASLSCDVWRLNKTWQPQRWHTSRGRLWGHLKRIRLRAAKRLDDGETDKAWSLCSRPHVFLQRNLRLCKSKPKSKAKPARKRAKPVQPLRSAHRHRRKKRKSSENEDTSEGLSSSVNSEDELPVNHGAHHEALEKVPKKRSSSPASSFVDIPGNRSSLEGTRRVLKFDTSDTSGHGDGSVFRVKTARSGDVPGEDLDAFRTPVDHFEAESKIVRKTRPSRRSAAQKDSFRNMLVAVARAQNQIIKESHH